MASIISWEGLSWEKVKKEQYEAIQSLVTPEEGRDLTRVDNILEIIDKLYDFSLFEKDLTIQCDFVISPINKINGDCFD